MDYSNNFGGGGGGGGGYNEYDNQMGGNQMTGGPQMGGHIARPRVDVEASGEVDPNLYPQPKEATHKIRGKSDILEMFCGSVDQELLPVKSFYFFFYAAFGSLFPLMGIYFKQMGMNPGQCGILIGMRPFVEFLSAPFWGSYADRCKQGKKLLLASLTCWVVFTLPLGFIQPEAVKCIVQKNSTTFVLETTKISKRDLRAVEQLEMNLNNNYSDNNNTYNLIAENITNNLFSETITSGYEESNRNITRERRSVIGISPLKVNFASNYDHLIHKDYIRPIFSSMVYRTADVQKAFFLLLLVVLIGEFFSAPAITLADSAVITLLGDDADKYGHQRMFGSLGWGLSMFFVGIALDHSTSFPDHPCGPERQEKNYTICFATFSVLMTAAIITASQITFKYAPEDEPQPINTFDQNKQNAEDEMQNQLAAQLQLPSLAVAGSGLGSGGGICMAPSIPLETDIGAQSKMFAQTTRQMPEWVTVLQHFKDLKCAAFLFVAWFMGFGIGLIFTFLFWHLQDYGGSPTLFGVASVINHISEIFAYFFSFRLITQIGHVKVLCLGLIGNIVRFLYISWLRNPWWVLPFEFMQGITHAAVWAACCSYIAHNTPQHLRASSQGVLQGIHHGLGRGCGAVIGGMFVSYFGTTSTFRGYGIVCIFVLAGFIFINFYRKEQGFISDIPITEDPHQVAEETSHLAPHGVPSNPIPRALSSQRLNEINNGQYGTYQTSAGGNLDIPGGAPQNPFLQQ